MSAANQPINPSLLRTLIPLNSLKPENLAKLARQAVVETHAPGQTLFRKGDTDPMSIYLLSGEIILESGESSLARTIVGQSEEANHTLSSLKPRQYAGVTKTPVTIVRLDSQLLDAMLTWDQVSGIEVTEFGGDDEDRGWMTKILRTGRGRANREHRCCAARCAPGERAPQWKHPWQRENSACRASRVH